MPVYEYYCKDCRNKFELLTTYTASEVDIECAKCHSSNVRKLFSVFARSRGGATDDLGGDFGDYGDGSDDFGGDDGEYMSGGSCACGGACGCDD